MPEMDPTLRRIIAVDAHRRRTGRCPVRIDSLGTGESFAIEATDDGFVDLASGTRVRGASRHLLVADGDTVIDVAFDDDVTFSGQAAGERYSGRAGGGCSVTVYDETGTDYFQYAIVEQAIP